jgi:hypothetical protein
MAKSLADASRSGNRAPPSGTSAPQLRAIPDQTQATAVFPDEGIVFQQRLRV